MSKIAIIVGSKTDWPVMEGAILICQRFQIEYDGLVVSAHRTPEWMVEFAQTATKKYAVIIAAAGGAAHLPGMIASLTPVPVIGVPIAVGSLNGLDALLSIVQMPNGIPVACVAINASQNAALLAIRILAVHDKKMLLQYEKFTTEMKEHVMHEHVIKPREN